MRGAAAARAGGLIAVLALLWPLPAVADSPIHGWALGAYAGGGVAMADLADPSPDPFFQPKAQFWYATGLAMELPLGEQAGLGFSLGFHHALASGAALGYLYRGYLGLESGIYLLGRGRPVGAEAPTSLLGGMALGISGSFMYYTRTELLFFFPSLLLEPYVELHPPRLGRHTFSLGLLNRLDFRRDMDLSASVGLNLRWRWYPGWNKEEE